MACLNKPAFRSTSPRSYFSAALRSSSIEAHPRAPGLQQKTGHLDRPGTGRYESRTYSTERKECRDAFCQVPLRNARRTAACGLKVYFSQRMAVGAIPANCLGQPLAQRMFCLKSDRLLDTAYVQ